MCDIRVAGLDQAIEKLNELNKLLNKSKELITEISQIGLRLESKDLFETEDSQSQDDQ